jgi:hypothetical protein
MSEKVAALVAGLIGGKVLQKWGQPKGKSGPSAPAIDRAKDRGGPSRRHPPPAS